MKNFICIIFALFFLNSFSQKDTLVKNNVYTSLYSFSTGQPVYVKYKLYKGGGVCSRKDNKFNFKKDSIIIHITANGKDYEDTGYDQGHMANAEDFAYDCTKEEKTFRYYNCSPQTVSLNRGIWKANENKVRELSQTDSILVICGGIINKSCKPIKKGSKLIVPAYFYKLVISLTSHKVVYCGLFTNTDDCTEKEVKMAIVEGKLRYYFEKITSFSIKE